MANNGTNITATLSKHRDSLIAAWGDAVRATYPKVRIKFSKSPGQFNDPLGHLLARDLPALFDIVVNGAFEDAAALEHALDPICRLRSVQEFGAAEAVAWVFSLKKLLREHLLDKTGASASPEITTALLRLETNVDRLALHAFDLHMSCREEAYDVRVREAQRQSNLIVKHFSEKGKRMFAEGEGAAETDEGSPAQTGSGMPVHGDLPGEGDPPRPAGRNGHSREQGGGNP